MNVAHDQLGGNRFFGHYFARLPHKLRNFLKTLKSAKQFRTAHQAVRQFRLQLESKRQG